MMAYKPRIAVLVPWAWVAFWLAPTVAFGAESGPARRSGAETGASSRKFTFFVISDPHVGAEHPKATPPVTAEQTLKQVQQNLDRMRSLIGQPFPKPASLPQLDLGNIGVPRGLFILGDLTDGHKELAKRRGQWKAFEDLYPSAGTRFGTHTVPVFISLGNHDGEATGPQGEGLIRHNRTLQAAGHFAAISDNGLHYAINWQGIHLVCVNLCPADTVDEETLFRYGNPGQGSWNDPQGALSFLKEYLRNRVGNSDQPVIILQHYGFDGFSLNDWNWWTPRQRRAMYEAIKDYNVIAIVHGHDHHAEHYRWPDPKRHAEDIKATFGTAPVNPRQFEVIACGNRCWVFHVKGQRLIAAHIAEVDGTGRISANLVKVLELESAQTRPGRVDQGH